MTPSRRALLAAAGALAATRAAAAPAPAWPGGERVELWPPGAIPGSRSPAPIPHVENKADEPTQPFRLLTGVDRPFLQVHRAARPDGSAVLLIPGGSYQVNAFDYEGADQAKWLNARGTTAFILVYRLPMEGWAERGVVPLQDAQRAVRLIRARPRGFGIDPARLAAIGFSAGGHLCGSLATRAAETTYAPLDAADALSARPDMAGLIYPVVSGLPTYGHIHSMFHLLGPGAGGEALERVSVERRVDASTPPLFIAHATDDETVVVDNSLQLHAAARKAGVPAELHLFAEGGHGFKAPPGWPRGRPLPAAGWPALFTRFALSRGLFRDPTSKDRA